MNLCKDYVKSPLFKEFMQSLHNDYVMIIYINKPLLFIYLSKQLILCNDYVKSLILKESPSQKILIYVCKDYVKIGGIYG